MSDWIFLHKDRKGTRHGGTASPCLMALIEWLGISFCALSQSAFLPHAALGRGTACRVTFLI